MKLTVKTLKGEVMEVQIQLTQTVMDLKNKVKDIKGFDVDTQKIVFKGKATNNTDQLDKLGVKQGDFLVVMTIVKKPEPKVQQKKVQENVQEKSQQKKQVVSDKPKQGDKKQQKPEVKAEQVSPQTEAQINELMSMGFPRQKCVKALKAAWNDPDRAVQYLLNGIPQNVPQQPNLGGGSQGDMGSQVLGQLVNSPQFAQIKQIIRTNPAALQPILMQIQNSSPQLYNLIAAHPQTFERLIMQDSQGTGSQGTGNINIPQMPQQPPPGSIMVTPEQQQAIQRLADLGFSKLQAAQAYMACDKNEELAANLLFDRLANGDIDPQQQNFGGNGNNGGNGGNNGGNGGNGNNEDDDDNLFN